MRHLRSSTLLAAAAAVLIGSPAAAQAPDDAERPWWRPVIADVRADPARSDGPEEARDRTRGPDEARDRARQGRNGARGPEAARDRARQGPDRAHETRRGERGRSAERGGDVRGATADRQGHGPPFCRNGSGHPVHGWGWCVDKGWAGHGLRSGGLLREDSRWERASWEDVVFRRGLPDGDTRMDEPGLLDVLGSVVLGRLDREARGERFQDRSGNRLEGRWLPQRDGSSILQVRAGARPLAEMIDSDGDRRVDTVLLHRERESR